MVFAMIVLGAVTRLTHSGLSIVAWDLVYGILPPLSESDWQQAFTQYQQFPEYQKVNAGMTLSGYKAIFWLEYVHRLWGRVIGMVFLLPGIYFIARGTVRGRLALRLMLMFVLGGLQGLLGWYMVKSGLVDKPQVSPYRLTAHLVAACVLYVYMLWTAWGLWHGRTSRSGATHVVRRLRARALFVLILVATTIVSGGFVAGMRAGYVFNDFPRMAGQWWPDGLLALQPTYLNFFENVITVQFQHRLLALTTLLLIGGLWLTLQRSAVSVHWRRAGHLVLGLVGVQVGLGIATLMLHVPVVLAASHQATGVLLLTATVWLNHVLRIPGSATGRGSV